MNRATSTIAHYDNSFEHLKALHGRTLRELSEDPKLCEREHERIRRLGVTKDKPDGNKVAANAAMRFVRAVYKHAGKSEDLPTRLPTSRVTYHPEPPRTGALSRAMLSAWEAERLAVVNPIMREVPLMLLLTGLRRRDACSIRWDEVDWERRVIVRTKSKGGRPFDLPMSTEIEAALGRLKTEGETFFPGSDWVFPSKSASGHVEEIKSIKVSVNGHDLRRSYKSLGIAAGVPKSVLRQLMNHADGDVSDRYQVDAAMMEFLLSMQQKISNYIRGAMAKPSA